MVHLSKRRKKLAEEILEKIKDRSIVDEEGRLPTERDLAALFRVSRNLLREALVVLECMGIIEVRAKEGLFVKGDPSLDFSPNLKSVVLWPENMLRDLMEMRVIIEVPAAGLAAKRRTAEDLKRMEECIRHLEEVYLHGEKYEGEGAKWDALLHTAIVEASGNRILVRFSEEFGYIMEKYIGQSRSLVFSRGDWPRIILDQHRALFAAIKDKDEAKAKKAALKHIELARKKFAG
ncbi:MAG TPA: hypothetical protein DEQ04_04260 [Thermovirga lienii]|nr:hypothetical protein [Thermovirga lienii]